MELTTKQRQQDDKAPFIARTPLKHCDRWNRNNRPLIFPSINVDTGLNILLKWENRNQSSRKNAAQHFAWAVSYCSVLMGRSRKRVFLFCRFELGDGKQLPSCWSQLLQQQKVVLDTVCTPNLLFLSPKCITCCSFTSPFYHPFEYWPSLQ